MPLMQVPLPAPPPIALAQAQSVQPLHNLAQVLESLSWDAQERGPLLIVAPERIQPKDYQRLRSTNTLPVPPPPETPLGQVAAQLNHRIEKAGGLSVVVPKTVHRLRGRPSLSPEVYEPQNPYQRSLELGYSLTQEQWRILGSEQGLGLDNLSPQQQRLFEAMFAPSLHVQRLLDQPLPDGSWPQPAPLTDAQRKGARLRISRKRQVYFLNQTGSGLHSFDLDDPEEGQLKRRFHLYRTGEDRTPLSDLVNPEVSNQPRESDVNPAASPLDASISLKGAETIGELFARIRQATGLANILPDARLAPLSVHTRGDQARAGDILQALCRAIPGTFRKVEGGTEAFYVLTDDKVGIGQRLLAYSEWESDGQMLRARATQARQKELEKDTFDYASITRLNDPLGIGEELVRKSMRNQMAGANAGIAVAELPQKAQEFVRKTLAQQPQLTVDFGGGEQTVSLRSDRVGVSTAYQIEAIIPELGVMDFHEAWGLTSIPANAEWRRSQSQTTPPPPRPIRYPPAWKERVVLMAPPEKDAWDETLRAAKKAGFNSLWVEVPLQAERAAPILAAAIKAGKEVGLPVTALVRLLRAPADALPKGARADVNINGETSAQQAERHFKRIQQLGNPYNQSQDVLATTTVFLEPTPRTIQAATEVLTRIARTPGLAGLALRDAAPPGYEEIQEWSIDAADSLGYSLENRLAFLRAEGVDPIDLPCGTHASAPPLFAETAPRYIKVEGQFIPDPKHKSMRKIWNRFRQERALSARKEVFTRLRQAAPDLRLLLMPEQSQYVPYRFFGLWEKPDAKLSGAPGGDIKQSILRAQTFSPHSLLHIRCYNLQSGQTEKQLQEGIRSFRQNNIGQHTTQFGPGGQTWSGFVADLTGVAPAQHALFLGAFTQDPPEQK